MLTTNSAYIDPDQGLTNGFGTLQFGTRTTAWTPPTGMPGGALPTDYIAFQGDGNQTFAAAAVPEPSPLVLIGLGLGLLGVSTLRARKMS